MAGVAVLEECLAHVRVRVRVRVGLGFVQLEVARLAQVRALEDRGRGEHRCAAAPGLGYGAVPAARPVGQLGQAALGDDIVQSLVTSLENNLTRL